MRCSVHTMNEWLYPDRFLDDPQHGQVTLRSARGGSSGFQLRLTDVPDAERLAVTFTSASPLGAEIFRELTVNVPVNTGVRGFTADWATANEYATREAPFDVYDPLCPVTADGFRPGRDEAIYVSLRPDPALTAGTYEGTLNVAVAGEEITIPVALAVADAVLPAETLKITNWFSLFNMAGPHGAVRWSEEHWRLIEAYGRAMRRIRQNYFWIKRDTVDVSVDGAGKYVFDFTRTERLIRLYLSLGFKGIEGAPLFYREGWDKAEFMVRTPAGAVRATSPEGYEFVAAYLRAWGDFLRRNGWYDITLMHVGDEPHERAADEYRILSGIVRKFLPGMKLIEAVETYDLNGAVDVWVPKNDYYERNRAQIEAHRAKGDEIWFYTCCIPGGHYANRLLDFPLLRTRMLHWGNYRYGLTGYLHWGLNQWSGDPYVSTAPPNGPGNRLPAGDSHILYPCGDLKKDGFTQVLGSMRGEMMKSGAEDYELLRALAEKDPGKADAICASVFRAFNDCDNTPAAFEAAHDALLDACASL